MTRNLTSQICSHLSVIYKFLLFFFGFCSFLPILWTCFISSAAFLISPVRLYPMTRYQWYSQAVYHDSMSVIVLIQPDCLMTWCQWYSQTVSHDLMSVIQPDCVSWLDVSDTARLFLMAWCQWYSQAVSYDLVPVIQSGCLMTWCQWFSQAVSYHLMSVIQPDVSYDLMSVIQPGCFMTWCQWC